MDQKDAKKIIESLLFVSDQPLPLANLKKVIADYVKDADVEKIIAELTGDYEKRKSAIELRFIAGGWQLSTKKEFGPMIKKFYRTKTTVRLSNSALETLSIVAYKQPITRSGIEDIRGVESSGVIDTLLERKLVRIVGRKEVLGRPLLYGTTQEFLHHFGLTHLSELPSMEEFTKNELTDISVGDDSSNQELPFEHDKDSSSEPEAPSENSTATSTPAEPQDVSKVTEDDDDE